MEIKIHLEESFQEVDPEAKKILDEVIHRNADLLYKRAHEYAYQDSKIMASHAISAKSEYIYRMNHGLDRRRRLVLSVIETIFGLMLGGSLSIIATELSRMGTDPTAVSPLVLGGYILLALLCIPMVVIAVYAQA